VAQFHYYSINIVLDNNLKECDLTSCSPNDDVKEVCGLFLLTLFLKTVNLDNGDIVERRGFTLPFHRSSDIRSSKGWGAFTEKERYYARSVRVPSS
jgi:hypothetical protein